MGDKKHGTASSRSLPRFVRSVACAATNPDQWITLYGDGRVRIHARNLGDGERLYRTLSYRPKLKTDREAIRRLIEHLNLTAAGYEGEECEVCSCSSSPNAKERDAEKEAYE